MNFAKRRPPSGQKPNPKLVSRRPESDSSITQLGIWVGSNQAIDQERQTVGVVAQGPRAGPPTANVCCRQLGPLPRRQRADFPRAPVVAEMIHPKGLSFAAQRQVVLLREQCGLTWPQVAEHVQARGGGQRRSCQGVALNSPSKKRNVRYRLPVTKVIHLEH